MKCKHKKYTCWQTKSFALKKNVLTADMSPNGTKKRKNEPTHEILALFVLRKFILQIRMRNHPVRLDVWFWSNSSSTSILHVCEQRRLWRDYTDAQARLSLRWSPMSQGFNSDTVWVDSLWKLSQILYESVTDSLTDGLGFFTVLVCPLEEEWKW